MWTGPPLTNNRKERILSACIEHRDPVKRGLTYRADHPSMRLLLTELALFSLFSARAQHADHIPILPLGLRNKTVSSR